MAQITCRSPLLFCAAYSFRGLGYYMNAGARRYSAIIADGDARRERPFAATAVDAFLALWHDIETLGMALGWRARVCGL